MIRRTIVVMGVTGCGKTTIGRLLAERLSISFVDGDDLHGPANVAKMSRGEALTDDDRWPWLDRVARTLASNTLTAGVVVSCSALRRAYRDRIRSRASADLAFVYLHGSRELITDRLMLRKGHFMPMGLLNSQFDALEVPLDEPKVFVCDIERTASAIVDDVIERLMQSRASGSDATD
jgi:gluconokinase